MTLDVLRPYLLLLVGISFTVVGEVMLKKGINDLGGFNILDPGNLVNALIRTFTNPFIFFGFVLIFCGALFWLTVLSELPLSVAYPMLAISYVIGTALSVALLGESVNGLRIGGLAIVVLGVILVGLSNQQPAAS